MIVKSFQLDVIEGRKKTKNIPDQISATIYSYQKAVVYCVNVHVSSVLVRLGKLAVDVLWPCARFLTKVNMFGVFI